MPVILRALTLEDEEQKGKLSSLAFGYPPPPAATVLPVGLTVGAFDDRGRLVAKATARPYEQWWCGRPVPMAGIAGVAVSAEARGGGLVRQMMAWLMARSPEPLSVLFASAPGIYRRLGWEVVGTLDWTSVPLSALPTRPVDDVTVGAAGTEDLDEIAALYRARGEGGSGLLTRTGASFPRGPQALLDLDMVSVAREDGQLTGYVAYDRGEGYQAGGPLKVWDLVVSTPAAMSTLLASLAGWIAVVGKAEIRGLTSDLALALGGIVPSPDNRQPWSLRISDPQAAVAARGFTASGSATFRLDGLTYRLEVSDGRGELTPTEGDGPVVTPQALALLYAGVADGRLVRAGLVDRPVPELEALFTGPEPEMLDYF